jgi:transketolase
MPWLNRPDAEWLAEIVSGCAAIYVIEDHCPVGGLGDRILATLMRARALAGREVVKFAVEGYPACGTPPEALRFHGLDGYSLASRILEHLGAAPRVGSRL